MNFHELFALKTLFERIRFIDEPVWQAHVNFSKYGLSFANYVAPQSEIMRELNKCLTWPIEKIGRETAGITVMTLPQGLSINKLLARFPELFAPIYPKLLERYGQEEVSHTYTLLMSNTIMEGTRSEEARRQLEKIGGVQGERPKIIEIMSLLVLTYLNFGKKLLGSTHQGGELYTSCEESVCAGYHAVIGGFEDEINVLYNFFSHNVKYGLTACRRV